MIDRAEELEQRERLADPDESGESGGSGESTTQSGASGTGQIYHHDHEGLADAGTIESFDQETGVLTIALTEGGSVSGLVTPRTRIHCDNGRHLGRHGLRHRLRHRRASASDAHTEVGESHRQDGEGEDSHEAGDDPPGHDGTAPGRSEGPGHGADHSAACSTEDLTEGATVKFADLVLVDGKAIFKMVALPAVQLPAVQSEGES